MNNKDFDKIMEEKRIQKEALVVVAEMLANMAPDDLKPALLLPGYVSRTTGKIAKFLDIDAFGRDAKRVNEFAVGACEFLARVEEAIDAFIEQNIPGGGDK